MTRHNVRSIFLTLFFAITTCSILKAPDVLGFAIFDKQIKQLISKAKGGDKRAQYKLGVAYMSGTNIRFDAKKAVSWFQKSAAQNYTKAWYRLGQIHHEERYGMRNQKTAFKYFLKAATNNHARSQYYTALYYYTGEAVTQKIDAALLWATRSKQRGVTEANALIQKIQGKLQNNLAQNTDNTSPRPNPGIKPATKRDRKPTLNARKLLHVGNWKNNNIPSDHIPSISNRCTDVKDKIRCISRTIQQKESDYTASFKIVSLITNFKPKGKFTIRYRRKYLFVSRNNPNIVSEVPSLGLAPKVLKLQCRVLRGSQIRCAKPDKSVLHFTKR